MRSIPALLSYDPIDLDRGILILFQMLRELIFDSLTAKVILVRKSGVCNSF